MGREVDLITSFSFSIVSFSSSVIFYRSASQKLNTQLLNLDI